MDNQKRTENAIDRAEAMTKMLAENVKSDEEDIYIKVSAVVQLLRELSSVNSQHSGDLISREKTLTAFADYVGSGMSMNDFDALWDIVAKMPAVNPQPCEDAISRQAALDEIRKCRFVVDAIEKIRGLPPVTPQLKTGHWILDDDKEHGRCSECGCKEDLVDGHSSYKWCSNCGAKMSEIPTDLAKV